MRVRASQVTTATAAVVLLGLGVTTVGSVVAIDRSNQRVTQTREMLASFIGLEGAIAAEAFAEAGYLRAPSPVTWARLEEALDAVPPLIAELREDVGRTDGITMSHLAVLNGRYAAQVREHRGRGAGTADDRVAGPALDAMDELLDATTQRYRDEVTVATAEQAELLGLLRVLLPVVFVIAFGTLAWTLRLTVRDQRRLAREAAAHRALARTDALTGLPNRAALLGAMGDVLGDPRSSPALLYLDLDRFKPVNDTWGHEAGDEVLRQVADRLRAVVRDDDVPARLGGDEFAVFLPRGDDAQRVAERILAAFGPGFDVGGPVVDVGASIGIAGAGPAGRNPRALLRAADEALYVAKRAGRGRVETARAS